MSTQTPNLGLVKPADEEFYDVQIQNQNMDKIDQAVNGKLDKTGDSKDNTVTFVDASSRTAILTTDNHAVLFGKIKKWLTDLGTAAFKNVGTTSSSVASGDAPAAAVSTHNSSGSAHSSLFAAKLSTSLKGAANGLAELDASGKVPSTQLPSYVDDVLEYDSSSAFPNIGETGKIYVALNTNLAYRWSGSAYVEISPGVALGETSNTAYRGDRGALAYAHSQATGNPHGTTAAQIGAVAYTPYSTPTTDCNSAPDGFSYMTGTSNAPPWFYGDKSGGIIQFSYTSMWKTQVATSFYGSLMAVRRMTNGVWGAWANAVPTGYPEFLIDTTWGVSIGPSAQSTKIIPHGLGVVPSRVVYSVGESGLLTFYPASASVFGIARHSSSSFSIGALRPSDNIGSGNAVGGTFLIGNVHHKSIWADASNIYITLENGYTDNVYYFTTTPVRVEASR